MGDTGWEPSLRVGPEKRQRETVTGPWGQAEASPRRVAALGLVPLGSGRAGRLPGRVSGCVSSQSEEDTFLSWLDPPISSPAILRCFRFPLLGNTFFFFKARIQILRRLTNSTVCLVTLMTFARL